MHTLLLLLALQLTPAPAASTQPSADTLCVYVLTMGPGDEPWEKFGHNMLWFYDPDGGIDAAYNWGMFDFDQKNFLLHFVQGRLWYWMEGFNSGIIQNYLDDDRTIWAQELNLPADRILELLKRCQDNAREENRYYRYDYFKDNCSTRVRDAVDHAVDGQLQKNTAALPTQRTFRSESLRLTAGTLWLYTSLNFILGQPTDRKLSAWDEMFVPMRMRDRLNSVWIDDASGRRVPLVRKETMLHVSHRPPLRDEPPRWTRGFFAAGMGWGIVNAAAGVLLISAARWRRWAGALLLTPWLLLSTLAGGIGALIWLLTDHAAARPNENVLQFNPLCLFALVLVPLALRGRISPRRSAFRVGAAVLLCSVLGLALKPLPMMMQHNASMIALALPANAGLCAALWMLGGRAILKNQRLP